MQDFITYVIGLGGAFIAAVVFTVIYRKSITLLPVALLLQVAVVSSMLTMHEIHPNPTLDKILGVSLIVLDIGLSILLLHRRQSKPLQDIEHIVSDLASGHIKEQTCQYSRKKNELGNIRNALCRLIEKLQRSLYVAEEVGKGNVSATVQADMDTGDLNEALSKMITELNMLTRTINESARQVKTGSQQLSQTAQGLSGRANQQASSTEELATAMQEQKASSEQNAENAKEAQHLGNIVNDNIKYLNQAITSTSEAITQIANKILIVNEIAEKTDILAINAGIEAARAGQSGKGFAVVAKEIRSLAVMAMNAAHEIEQTTTQSTETVGQSVKKLASMTPDIEKTAVYIKEIAAASIEQNNSFSEINQSVHQLTETAQEHMQVAEELANNSEKLELQSSRMLEAVSVFQSDEEGEKADNTPKPVEKQIQHLNKLLQQYEAQSPQ